MPRYTAVKCFVVRPAVDAVGGSVRANWARGGIGGTADGGSAGTGLVNWAGGTTDGATGPPNRAGGVRLTGAGGMTTAVGAESTVVLPPGPVAVSTTTIVCPTSAAVTG